MLKHKNGCKALSNCVHMCTWVFNLVLWQVQYILPQGKKHVYIPMTHFSSGLSSEKSIVAVQLHGKWIDNKPQRTSKVAEYWAVKSLGHHNSHFHTPDGCRSCVKNPTVLQARKLLRSFMIQSKREQKGQLHSQTGFKINQRCSQLHDGSHRAPSKASKALLHMTTERPDQRVPSWQ